MQKKLKWRYAKNIKPFKNLSFIKLPKTKTVDAKTTRPTLARVKESTFNLIQGRIDGAVVLDLFAGSGAFGAECISRGAKKVVLLYTFQL